jgi:hypothetical protein
MEKRKLYEALNAHYYKARSNWERGVVAYALELFYDLDDAKEITEKVLLNGAKNWCEYSEGGCALIHDADICLRLCAPWEIKRKRGGALPPNGRETWLDVQARALYQAASLILRIENHGY